MKKADCVVCGEKGLDKNTQGLNKKFLGTSIHNFYCMVCLANYLDVTEEELLEKIEEFKEEGCTLFE